MQFSQVFSAIAMVAGLASALPTTAPVAAPASFKIQIKQGIDTPYYLTNEGTATTDVSRAVACSITAETTLKCGERLIGQVPEIDMVLLNEAKGASKGWVVGADKSLTNPDAFLSMLSMPGMPPSGDNLDVWVEKCIPHGHFVPHGETFVVAV